MVGNGFAWKLGKISAQPHISLCEQFLDKENIYENNYYTLRFGKRISMELYGNLSEYY